MAKVPITMAIEKDDLQILIKIAREKHHSVQTLIRLLINKQLKKIENENTDKRIAKIRVTESN